MEKLLSKLYVLMTKMKFFFYHELIKLPIIAVIIKRLEAERPDWAIFRVAGKIFFLQK